MKPKAHALVIYDDPAERDSLVFKFVSRGLHLGDKIETVSVEPRRVTNVLKRKKDMSSGFQKNRIRVSDAVRVFNTDGNPFHSFTIFYDSLILESEKNQVGCSFTSDAAHLFYEQFQQQKDMELFVENKKTRPTTLCLYKKEGFSKLRFDELAFLFQCHDSVIVNSTLFVRQNF